MMPRLWHRLFGHGQTYSWTTTTSPAIDTRWWVLGFNGWWYIGCQKCGNSRVGRYSTTTGYPY